MKTLTSEELIQVVDILKTRIIYVNNTVVESSPEALKSISNAVDSLIKIEKTLSSSNSGEEFIKRDFSS